MANSMPSKEEVLKKVEDSFTNLDQQRITGLERMKTLHAIKNDSLERGKLRLSKKYGDLHPRVTKISERLAYNQGLKKELDHEIEKTRITVPAFDINTWMVHGRILNKEGNGLDGLTVSLYDKNGNWIEGFGHECTNYLGYFAILYKADPKKRTDIPKKKSALPYNYQQQIQSLASVKKTTLRQDRAN